MQGILLLPPFEIFVTLKAQLQKEIFMKITNCVIKSLILSLGFSLSASVFAAPPSKPTGLVVVGVSQEPTVLHPLLAAIEVDQGVWWNIYDPLWAIDEKGKFLPKLAEEVPTVENGGVSADGLNWHIKLRKDVKWHDGTPFTAHDVKYTLDLIKSPTFNSKSRQGHDFVENIEVVNDYEIKWKMKKPYAPYLSLLASTFIVPKHILEKDDNPNASSLSSKPIGTGPFKFDKRISGDRIVLVANENYYGDGPYLERLEFKYIPDMNSLYTQFRTGQIDVVGIQGIPHNFYEEIKKVKTVDVNLVPTASIEAIAINHGNPILKDKVVRQALYQAINRQAIVDLIYYGIPELTESFIPKTSWAYAADLPTQVYDIDAANKLLDDAGWKKGPDGIRVKDGRRLSFTINTTSGNELRAQTEQLLQQDWKKIGVNVNINNMPAAVMWGTHWTQSKFDAVLVALNFITGSDPDATRRLSSGSIPAQGGKGANTFQYKNPTVDELFSKGIATFDLNERKKIYGQIQHILRDDLAFLPIYQVVHIEGHKKGLDGFVPNVNVLSNAWNAGSWYWNK